VRTVALDFLPLALAVDARAGRAFAVGPAVPNAQTALRVGDVDAALLLSEFDTGSGALLRTSPRWCGASALAVDGRSGRLFVSCASDDTVRVVDTRSGVVLRTVTLAATPSGLAVDERRGRLYVVSGAGTLSLRDARTGTLLATQQVDPSADLGPPLPVALAVDERRDRVYLTTWGPLAPGPQGPTPRGNGTLYALDALTGAVLRRIAVGVAPQAVAVEEGSGRVVVVNRGGVVIHTADGWGELWIGRLRSWLPWLGRYSAPAPTLTDVPGSVSVIAAGT
jgi:DNA-binding beta-propeller fold protein YncE